MEVKIGVKGAPREISLESHQSVEEITAAVREALAGDDGVLVLTGDKGQHVLVPADKLGYIEIGEQVERKVGFGAM